MNVESKMVLVIVVAACMSSAGLVYMVRSLESGPHELNDLLSTFGSYGDLKDFMTAQKGNQSSLDYGLEPSFGMRESLALVPHSNTNVQVSGVDEEDIVKTDGTYLYIASYSSVEIIQAYPPSEMRNMSTIQAKDVLGMTDSNTTASIQGIYLSGDRLVIIASVYDWVPYYYYDVRFLNASSPVAYEGPRSYVVTYDVSDAQSPRRLSSYGVSGGVLTSRMTNDVVFLVTQSYSWINSDEIATPKTWVGGISETMPLEKIHYDPETRETGGFLNVLSVNVHTEAHDVMSIVAGWASTIYMSQDALYLTVQKWTGDIVLSNDSGAVAAQEDSTKTTIYRITVEGVQMAATARGEVGGWLLNQFSMDENGQYLRVATTSSWTAMKNSVYVLGPDLSVVGALKGIAPGERIYSARFVGDTLYLVTFRQMDPLFVIDLSVPSSPAVLGELVMPGFSSYLQPIDKNHLFGIGSESSNVKVSVYDVTNPMKPSEVSKFVVGADSSYSDAQWDHKAVMYDADRGILVIPVSTYSHMADSSYSQYQSGAYVFTISVENGVSLKGVVKYSDVNYYSSNVLRSLYIGNHLYTVSNTQVKANNIDDLSDEGTLVYNAPQQIYPMRIEGNATVVL
jgi:inhibitor of cysteine peptidase